MRVAIIGGGAAGLATAWLLQQDHEVHVFEADPEPGGHARTAMVEHQGAVVQVETGFRYFFEATYPKLMALMALLGLELSERESRISLTRAGMPHVLSLPPTTPSQLLQLCRRPSDLRHLALLRRFMTTGDDVVERADWSLSLREYLAARGFPERFGRELLYPMVAASWGAPLSIMPDFPAYSVLKVMRLTDGRGKFLELEGGISTYIRALVDRLGAARLHLGRPIRSVARDGDALAVTAADGERLRFDKVVLATPAIVAQALLADDPALADWRARRRPFDHFEADICIHGDPSWMPRRRADWADLNHFHEPDRAWMTEWLGLEAGVEVFRTWLPKGAPVPDRLWHRCHFQHLVVTKDNLRLQQDIAAAQGQDGLFAVGMYAVDVDNHESAVGSAMPVAEALAPGSATLAAWRQAVAERRAPPRTSRPGPRSAASVQRPTGPPSAMTERTDTFL